MSSSNLAVGDHRDLLDIIDSLRSQGVSHYVALPEIIVCGDQSAGKSSVLEAIIGMSFPANDGVCTRFVTELVLRRGSEVDSKISIIPGEGRYGEDRERLENWQPKASIEEEGLGAVTNEAMRAMAEPAGTKAYYKDILRVELTGPEQPHLTMVDLPGLYRSGNKEQSVADVDLVRGIVKDYMSRERSIIVTVVSAQSNYVLQEVTSLAKDADRDGRRTMGLITKPDTLDVGSNSETYFVRLAQNLEAPLRLGWHVLKNRSFAEREFTSAERDTSERDFFNQGMWSSVDPSRCGVAALRARLSALLRDQILAQLPNLVQDVKDGIQDCINRLERLGPERETSQQQLTYLVRVSEQYTSLLTQAVEGTYTDAFFGDRNKIDKLHTRLRAMVQFRLREFAEDMRSKGQKNYIVDSESEDEIDRELRDSPRISRSEYVDAVADKMKYSKGRELPGLFNPLIVNDLFLEQCEPWGEIVRGLIEQIVDDTHATTQLIVEHVTASDVAERVSKVIRHGIEGLKVKLDAQVEVLLTSAAHHLITCNPQLTENVQRLQQARNKRDFKERLGKMFGAQWLENPDNKIPVNPYELLQLMEEVSKRQMEWFGCATAVDYMEAYYKVAVSRFIDDVNTLAIEACLISRLSTIFTSSDVVEMSSHERSHLAAETRESSSERKRLETKRAILVTGLRGLRSLHKRQSVVEPSRKESRTSKEVEQISVIAITRSEEESTASDDQHSSWRDHAASVSRSQGRRATPSPPPPPPADVWAYETATGSQGYVEESEIPLRPKKGKKKTYM